MTRNLYDVDLEHALVEHYLFDLGYPTTLVSEILDVDEKRVKEIYENYRRAFGTRGKTK